MSTLHVCVSIVNHIDDIMVRMLVLSAVDHGLESQSGQTKDNEICMC